VLTKIDVDRMANGKELAHEIRKSDAGGIPWIAFLDSRGATIVTGDGPKGNIGCPAEPYEIDHFMSMLRKVRSHLTEQELSALEQDLRAYGKKLTGH
jgi:hypothetical protein